MRAHVTLIPQLIPIYMIIYSLINPTKTNFGVIGTIHSSVVKYRIVCHGEDRLSNTRTTPCVELHRGKVRVHRTVIKYSIIRNAETICRPRGRTRDKWSIFSSVVGDCVRKQQCRSNMLKDRTTKKGNLDVLGNLYQK